MEGHEAERECRGRGKGECDKPEAIFLSICMTKEVGEKKDKGGGTSQRVPSREHGDFVVPPRTM